MAHYITLYTPDRNSLFGCTFAHHQGTTIIMAMLFRFWNFHDHCLNLIYRNQPNALLGSTPTLTHALLGRPVTNVPALPTQHLGGLEHRVFGQKTFVSVTVATVEANCQIVSHW
jgi:hypothetical protein